MRKIYLACPYSHPNQSIRKARAHTVACVAAQLLQQQHLVFSPITHGHAIANTALLPSDWAFWKKHCYSFLDYWADELLILTLVGWQESIGVTAELHKAKELGLAIRFLQADSHLEKDSILLSKKDLEDI